MMRTLSVAVGTYDRTRAVLDGAISLPGWRLEVTSPPLEQLFQRAFDASEFDVAELSLGNFLLQSSISQCSYVALPIFPSRMFRHSAIFVRTDRGIEAPADLVGRTVGIREYSNTATLTAKGVLSDEYGVRAQDISWVFGAVDADEEPPRSRRTPIGVELRAAPSGTSLSGLLAQGDLDAVISYKPPACFSEQPTLIRRLFSDYRSAEEAYFRRTGIFPIMHLVGVRRELADLPGLCLGLCEMFERSKQMAFEGLDSFQALAVSLPWAAAEARRTREVMGGDPWPYSFAANARALEAALRWTVEQGLVETKLQLKDLFEGRSWKPKRQR